MAELNEKAKKVFALKYSTGKSKSWRETCRKIADFIADGERPYGKTEEEIKQIADEYYEMLFELWALPGGRIIANAGTGIKNLANCFVLGIEDSRTSIYETLKNAAEVFAMGGGVGYSFSNVRETGADINTTGGKASGPLSFMSLFDQTGEVIQQASRRGAQLGSLLVSHPDIEEFIGFKSTLNTRNDRLMKEYDRNLNMVGGTLFDTKYERVLTKTLLDDQLTHFNISVLLTDDFMEAVENDQDWELVSPSSGKVVKTVRAKDLLYRMAKQAWESGDPGELFYDRINEDNLVPYIGDIVATNPCLTGDANILTVDGVRSFKDLADSGEDVLVYAWNKYTKLPVIRWMRNPRLTRKNSQLVEVTLDSGLKIKCTPDHNFYTFRGNKVRAIDLKPNQAIRAFSMSIHRDGHLRAHGWADGKTNHQYVARMIWECYYGEIPEGYIVHHIDENKEHNWIENLELIDPITHNQKHYKERLQNGFFYNETREEAMCRNHKVVSVEWLEEREDVYNGTVDDVHTYIVVDDNPVAGIVSGIVSANCGEVPLLTNESCILTSINLHQMYDKKSKSIDYEKLRKVTKLATRFLEDVTEITEAPLPMINEKTKGLRRLGLGILGFADLLVELDIPYSSKEAVELSRYLSWFINFHAWETSYELAKERGAFPLYNMKKINLSPVTKVLYDSEYGKSEIPYLELRLTGVRNNGVTSIAPTGSIAIIGGVNSGIEPFFALAYRRYITEGVGNIAKDSLFEVNPALEGKLKNYGFTKEQITEIVAYAVDHGSLIGCDLVNERIQEIFLTANDIHWKAHVDIQAAWQEYVSNAISKTVNMPQDATIEDILECYFYMWKKGLKGGTIYRNLSKSFQILNAPEKKES